MKTARRRWLMMGAMLAAVLSAWGIHRWRAASGPIYAGHSVAYWYAEACRPEAPGSIPSARAAAGEQALRQFGTNALPFLVQQALSIRPESALRARWRHGLERIPFIGSSFRSRNRDELLGRTMEFIQEISLRPTPPKLMPLFRSALESPDTGLRRQALGIVSGIHVLDEDFVPHFARALRESDPDLRERASEFLEQMGGKAAGVLPDLVALLRQAELNAEMESRVAGILGHLGPRATPALPVLQQRFAASTHDSARLTLAVALCRIDGDQTEAMAWITNRLIQTQRPLWSEFSLRQLGTNGLAAAPALLAILNGTNTQAWQWVVPCLEEAGVPPALYLPRLRELLASDDDPSRLMAARDILATRPGDTQAQAYLIDVVKNPASPPDAVRSALIFLARVAPRSRPAVPAILTVFDRTNVMNWRGAVDTLRVLEMPPDFYLPRMTEKLAASDPSVVWQVAVSILEVDPAHRPAQLALVDLIRGESPLNCAAIADLVRLARPPIPEVRPVLSAARQSRARPVRDAAERALAFFTPKDTNGPARRPRRVLGRRIRLRPLDGVGRVHSWTIPLGSTAGGPA